MVGVAALLLVAGVQGRSSSFVSDMYYDSARKLLVWGEITAHPELKGRDYWEYNFCFTQDGKSGRVRVQYPPYVIVDEKRFVTHWDYAAMVEATTGKVTYLGRVPVRASSGRHLFLEGTMLSTDRDNRKTSIAMRSLDGEGTSGKTVVTGIDLPIGVGRLDNIAVSRDEKTIAWSLAYRDGDHELFWEHHGVRHDGRTAATAFVVSSSGKYIYALVSSLSGLIVMLDAESGEYLGKFPLRERVMAAMCADASSDDLVLVLDDEWSIALLAPGTKLREAGIRLRPASKAF